MSLHKIVPSISMKEMGIEQAISKLMPQLPADANGVFVVIRTKTPGLVGFDFTVKLQGKFVPVKFWPADDEDQDGAVTLAYSQGNLESFELPNVSENDLETL